MGAKATLKALLSLLKLLSFEYICTDGWPGYRDLDMPEPHVVTENLIQRIGRKNVTAQNS